MGAIILLGDLAGLELLMHENRVGHLIVVDANGRRVFRRSVAEIRFGQSVKASLSMIFTPWHTVIVFSVPIPAKAA